MREVWHPTFEELMLFLNEPNSASAKIEAHVRTCWTCLSYRRQIERATSAFMDDRNASLGDAVGFPKHAVPAFEQKLTRLALESGPQRLLPRIKRQLQLVSPMHVTALAGCVLLLVLMMRLVGVPPVSASRILGHMREAEAEQLQQTALPVLYEKLRLRRYPPADSAESLTWEIWRDTKNGRYKRRVWATQAAGKVNSPPAAFTNLERIFAAHQVRIERALSADAFRSLSQAMHNPLEQVRQQRLASGEEAFVLSAADEGPLSRASVVKVELTVRKRDWRAVEERLEVRSDQGTITYEISSLTMGRLHASVFDAEIRSAPPKTSARAFIAPSAPAPLAREIAPSDADLTRAEIEAWHAIHSIGACLGRPLTVTKTESSVSVAGIVEDELTKSRIADGLRGVPHVTVDIRTLAEARSMAAHPPADIEVQVNTHPAVQQTIAAEHLLTDFFANEQCATGSGETTARCIQQAISDFSKKVLTSSEAVLEHAWALRQLAALYGSIPKSGLRVSSRGLVDLMARDHLTKLRREWEHARATVVPVLHPYGAEPPGADVPATENWMESSLRVSAGIERSTTLMLGMFVQTNRSVPEPHQAGKALLHEVRNVDDGLAQLEIELALEFSNPPKTASQPYHEPE
jgi:hypothetical protein